MQLGFSLYEAHQLKFTKVDSYALNVDRTQAADKQSGKKNIKWRKRKAKTGKKSQQHLSNKIKPVTTDHSLRKSKAQETYLDKDTMTAVITLGKPLPTELTTQYSFTSSFLSSQQYVLRAYFLPTAAWAQAIQQWSKQIEQTLPSHGQHSSAGMG